MWRTIGLLVAASSALMLTGCSITQNVMPLEQKPQQICVVENKAVKEGVLEALQEGLHRHGAATRVIPGSYVLQQKMWIPAWQTTDAKGCDAMAMYVANWNWDLAMYMYFANIWMTSPDKTRDLGHAIYDASRGGGRMDKFIDARGKVLELVDALLAGSQPSTASPILASESAPPSAVDGTAERLKQLDELRDRKLISVEEYEAKRRAILDSI